MRDSGSISARIGEFIRSSAPGFNLSCMNPSRRMNSLLRLTTLMQKRIEKSNPSRFLIPGGSISHLEQKEIPVPVFPHRISRGMVLLSTLLFATGVYAGVEANVTLVPLDKQGPPVISVVSHVDGEVRFVCVGKGYLKTATLVKEASAVLIPPTPAVYQYRLHAGAEKYRGSLKVEAGMRTEVAIFGDYAATPSIRAGNDSEDLEYHPSTEPLTIPNPFGPAFEKLSIEEKLRLVQESPDAQRLSSQERNQLLGFLYNEKGVQEAGKKNYAMAEEVLRKASQLLPGEVTVKQNLAFAIAGNGNQQRLSGSYASSEKKLTEAQNLAEGTGDTQLSAQIRLALAALYVDQALAMPGSEQKRRQGLLEKALEQDPDQPMALFHLGQIAYQNYDLETALDLFQRAYQGTPQPDLAELIVKVQKEIQEAGDFETQDKGSFKISFEGNEVRHVARETRRLLAQAQREMIGKFSLRPEGTIPVVIYSAGQFKQILGLHSWAGGAYDGKIRLPIADLSEEDLVNGKEDLRKLIFHEYTHALLHNRTAPARIPVWLHEGLAQNAAGQNPDNPVIHASVIASLNNGRLPMPSRLGGEFSGISDPSLAAQLYVESYLFVHHLIEKEGGWSRIRSLVSAIGGGESVESAIQKAYRKSLEELEQRWMKELNQ